MNVQHSLVLSDGKVPWEDEREPPVVYMLVVVEENGGWRQRDRERVEMGRWRERVRHE